MQNMHELWQTGYQRWGKGSSWIRDLSYGCIRHHLESSFAVSEEGVLEREAGAGEWSMLKYNWANFLYIIPFNYLIVHRYPPKGCSKSNVLYFKIPPCKRRVQSTIAIGSGHFIFHAPIGAFVLLHYLSIPNCIPEIWCVCEPWAVFSHLKEISSAPIKGHRSV